MDESAKHTPRYDQRLQHILTKSSEVFAEKGFHHASVRDISSRTGISLAGLYYYFQTKEELLFLIIENAFDSALENCKAEVNRYQGPDKVRFFIRNHLSIFIDNLQVAKVVVHEAESLTGPYRDTVQKKQREYFDFLVRLLEEQRSDPAAGVDCRLAALALLGMMNWIYTWYDPSRNQSTEEVGNAMADIFLRGFQGA